MSESNIEPVVLEVDDAPVREGVKRANDQIDAYAASGVQANQRIAASAQETGKQMRVLTGDVSTTDAKLAMLADNHQTRFDRMTADIERYGAGVDRAGRGVESAFSGLGRAAKGALEFAGAIAIGTKALAAHATAAEAWEAAVNRVRVARIATAGYVEGLGGALTVAGEIAAVVAIEKAAVSTYERAKQIQIDAVAAQKSGLSYSDVSTLSFVTGRLGTEQGFFDNAAKAAGGVDQLGEKLRTLSELRDPVDRVRKAFQEFGPDAEKILPFLGERFAENTQRVKDWALVLDETGRKNIDAFRRDIDALKGSFTGLGDAISAWAHGVGLTVEEMFAGIYTGLKGLLGELSKLGTPELRIFERLGGVFGKPQEIDTATTKRRALAGITDDAAAQAALATLNGLAGSGEIAYAADRGAGEEDRLRARVKDLASRLFDQQPTSSNFGKLIPGSQFQGGYPAEALALQEYVSSQNRISAIDAERKAQQELDAATKAVAATLQSAQLSELSGLYRLSAERDIAIKQYGKTRELVEQINQAFKIRFAVEQAALDKQNLADVRARASAEAAQQNALLDARSGIQAKAYLDVNRLAEDSAELRGKLELTQAETARDAQLRALDEVGAQSVQRAIAVEDRKAAIQAEYLRAAEALDLASIDNRYSRELAAVKVLYDAKLVSENVYQATVAALGRNQDIERQSLEVKTDAAIQAARENAAIRSAQIVQQEDERIFDTFKREAGGVFDALLTRSQNIFAAIGNAFKTAILTAIKDVVSSRIAASLTELVTGQKVELATEAVGNTPLARLAATLGLGAKPHFTTKLDQPNHLGDLLLAGNAVPVVVTNAAPTQAALQGRSLFGSGAAAGGALAALLGLGAAAIPAIAATEPVATPAGIVSSTINYGGGAVSTGPGSIFGAGSILGGPGGTTGFAGDVSLSDIPLRAAPELYGGSGGSASGIGGLGGLLNLFKGGGISASTLAPLGLLGSIAGLQGAFHAGQSNNPLLKGLAPGIGAVSGLLGFGSLTALFPSLVAAGPVGWIAAAGIGAAIGLTGLFRAAQQVHDKIRAIYGVDVKDNGVLQQIVGMAKQGFGGNLDVAVRSQQVRELIELYAMSTGQNARGIVDHAVASVFSNQNGTLSAVPTYFDGSPVLPGDLNSRVGLPTLINGNYVYSQTVTGANVVQQPQSVSVQLDGPSSAAFLQGQTVKAISSNPRTVSSANLSGQQQSAARREALAALLNPAAIIS